MKKHLHYKCQFLDIRHVVDYLNERNIQYGFYNLIGKWNKVELLEIIGDQKLFVCRDNSDKLIDHDNKINEHGLNWSQNLYVDDIKETAATVMHFFKHLWKESDQDCNLY